MIWWLIGWPAFSLFFGLGVARFIEAGKGESRRQVVRDVFDGHPHV